MVRAWIGVVATLLLAAFAASGPAPAAAPSPAPPSCGGPGWVASWIANPTDASTTADPLAQRTVRMIVRPSLGGSRLRLRLSNRYGAAPVTLGPVSVAQRDYGATLQPGTVRQVLFDGSATVTIRAGGEAASDPVDFRFSALDELAVSVYVPGTVRNPTEHFITRQA